MGRYDESLAEVETAVALLGQLGDRLSHSERHAHAAIQLTFGMNLMLLGRRQEALAAYQTGLAHFEQLPRRQQNRLPQLAIPLRVWLADSLRVVGDHAAAVRTATRVARLAERMDRLRPHTMRLLHAYQKLVLASAASEAGYHQTAVPAAQRAVELFRSLGSQNQQYALGLALALYCQSQVLAAAGVGDPVTPIRECVDIYTRLAQQQPEQYAMSWVQAAASLSDRLWDAGEHTAALEATDAAFSHYQALPASSTEKYASLGKYATVSLPRLSVTLLSRLSQQGAYERVTQLGPAIVTQLRQLVDETEQHQDSLRAVLHILGYALDRCDRPTEALRCTRERAAVSRELARQDPEAHRRELGTDLLDLGSRLVEAAPEEAIAVIDEALSMFPSTPETASDEDLRRWGLDRRAQALLSLNRDEIG